MSKLRSLLLVGFLLVLLTGLLMACSSQTSDDSDSQKDNQQSESNDETNSSDDSTADVDGEIIVAYSAQPPVLDPHVSTADAISDTMRHVWDTLVTVDSNYNIKPLLADSWEVSEDGKTYTFYLRQGVLFHNGKELKAEDVVASMNRWKDAPAGKGIFADATFEEVDEYTVELRLPEALSTTLPTISHGGAGFAAIMPKEVIENASDEGVEEYIGTGPFKFVEWKPDQYIHLTRFEDYVPREEPADGLSGKREALVKDLKFMFVADSSTREAGIRSGEYDFAHAVPFDNADALESDPNINNHIYPGGFLVVHFNKKQGLFTDVKARKAVAAALEMDSIMTAGYSDQKYYNLSHNFMMTHQHGFWGSDVGKDQHNIHDVELAKQLLEESGYNGEEIRLITTRDYEDQYHGSVVIQEQLQQIGMNINLEVYDWPTLLDRRNDPNNWEIFVIANVAVPEPTLTGFLSKDYPGWTDDPELDRLIHEFRTKPTLEEARDMFDDLQQWYWDYMPVLKIGDYNRVSSSRSTLENFQYQDGLIFWNVSNNK